MLIYAIPVPPVLEKICQTLVSSRALMLMTCFSFFFLALGQRKEVCMDMILACKILDINMLEVNYKCPPLHIKNINSQNPPNFK